MTRKVAANPNFIYQLKALRAFTLLLHIPVGQTDGKDLASYIAPHQSLSLDSSDDAMILTPFHCLVGKRSYGMITRRPCSMATKVSTLLF